MPLTKCTACGRPYPEHRLSCPSCGTENLRSSAGKKKGGLFGSSQRVAAAYLAVAALVGLNLWQATGGTEGPDPELEALHSSEEAREQCRVALRSQFPQQDPEIVGLGEVEYLQGGEYEVMATVVLRSRRGSRQVQALCELQFEPETGWTARPIDLAEG